MATTTAGYRVQAFAKLSGVTVRTLHHYDRLGLLVPRREGGARGDRRGYRLYSAANLERLEQIVALRYLGFPLRQIKTLLPAGGLPLRQALQVQQRLLREQRRRLNRALDAIQAALRPRAPNAGGLQRILREMAMANDPGAWTHRYFSAAAKASIAARAAAFTPAMQAEASRRWAALLAEVEAALDGDPRGPRAQALAARWRELIGNFTQGDGEVGRGMGRLWANRERWPAEMKQRTAGFRPEVMTFMRKAPALLSPCRRRIHQSWKTDW